MESNYSRTSSVLSKVDTNVVDNKTCKMNSSPLSTPVKNIVGEKKKLALDDQENKPPVNTEGFMFKKPLPKETMSKEETTVNTLIDGLNYLKLGGSAEPEKRFNLFKWTTPLKNQQTYSKKESPTRFDPSMQNQSYTATSTENDDKDSQSQSEDANSEYYDCSDEENSIQVDKSSDHLNTTGSSFHSVQEKDKHYENEIVSSDSELVSEARVAEMNRNQCNDDSFMLVKYLENTFSIDDENFKLELTMSDVSFRERTLASKINEEDDLEHTLNNITIDDQDNHINTLCQSPSIEEIEQTVQDVVNQSIEAVLILEDAPVELNVSLKDPSSMEQEINENGSTTDEIVESIEENCSSETLEIENPQHEQTKSEHETSIRNVRKSEIFPMVELVENGSFIKPESLEISLPYISDPFNVSIGTLDNLSPQLIFNSKTVSEQTLDDEIEEIEEIYGGLLEGALEENRPEKCKISVCDAINAENGETVEQVENINVIVADPRAPALKDIPVSFSNDIQTAPESDEVEFNQAGQSEDNPNVEPIQEPILDVTFNANDTCPFEVTGVIENIRFNHFEKPIVVQTSPKNEVETCELENTHLEDENDEPIPKPLNVTFDANNSTELNDTCPLEITGAIENIKDDYFKNPLFEANFEANNSTELNHTYPLEITGAIENIKDDYFKNPLFEANFDANESTRLIDNTESGLDATSLEPNKTFQLEDTHVLDEINAELSLSETFNANDSLEPNKTFQLEVTRVLDASNVEFAQKSLDVTSTINASFEPNETDQLEATRILNDTCVPYTRKSLDVTSTINASFEPNETSQLEATRVLNDTDIESARKSLDVTSTINVSFEPNETSQLEATRVLNDTGIESTRKSLNVTSTIDASFEPNETFQLDATRVLNDTGVVSARKSLNVTSTINTSFEPNETFQLDATRVLNDTGIESARKSLNVTSTINASFEPNETSQILNETDVECALQSLDVTREPKISFSIEEKHELELSVSNLSIPASVEPTPESGLNFSSTFPITQEDDDMRMEVDEDYPELETSALSVTSSVDGSRVLASECHEKVLYNELSDKWNTQSDLSAPQQEETVLNTTPLNSSYEMDETSPMESAEIEVTYEMKSRNGMFNDLESIPESNENESLNEQMTTSSNLSSGDISLVDDQQVESQSTSVVINESNSNDTAIVESVSLNLVAPVDIENSPESKNMANDTYEEIQLPSPVTVNSLNGTAISEKTSPITLTADEKSPISCNSKNTESDSSSSTIEANSSSPKEIEFNLNTEAACSPIVLGTDSTPTSDELPQKEELDDFSAFKTPNRPKLRIDSSFNADYCAGETPSSKSALKNSLISPRCSFKDRTQYSPFGISGRRLCKGTPKSSGDVSTNLLDMSIGSFQQFTWKTTFNNASSSQAEENLNRTIDVDEESRPEETKLLVIEEYKMVNVKTQTHDSELNDLKTEITNLKNQLAQKQKEFQEVLELAQKVHHNNVVLQEAQKQYEDNQRKLENKYELLKSYSNELLARRNEELDQLEIKYEGVLKKLEEKSAESAK